MADANFNVWHECHDKHGLHHLNTDIHVPISVHIWVLASNWEEANDRVSKIGIGEECDNTSVDHLSNENTNHDKTNSLGISIVSNKVNEFHVDSSNDNIDNCNTDSYENIEDLGSVLVSLEISAEIILIGGSTGF